MEERRRDYSPTLIVYDMTHRGGDKGKDEKHG
jgi:hypothetical protein